LSCSGEPRQQARLANEHSTAAYRDVTEAMDHLATLLREEIAALAERGCCYIQLDAPDLTFPINEATFFYEAAGLNREQFLEQSVELLHELHVYVALPTV